MDSNHSPNIEDHNVLVILSKTFLIKDNIFSHAQTFEKSIKINVKDKNKLTHFVLAFSHKK